MLRFVLLVFVTSALAGDLPMASTPIPPMASSPFPLFNPMKQQQFVSGSTPFIPNLTSNFSSSSASTSSGPGASFIPPGYGIQQVFYPPAIFYPGMGGAYGSFPNFAPNLPSSSMMNQNQPSLLGLQNQPSLPGLQNQQSLLGLQGHAAPVHQVPWYPTPASTCQGCNLIYRGLPYPGLVPNVQIPSNVQLSSNVQLPSNVPYVRNVPLEPLSQPLVNNWMPHNVQPLVEPLVQNFPNLYSPESVSSPVPSPVLSESVPLVPEPSSVVPESSPVVESLSPKEAVQGVGPEIVPKEVPSSSRQKRTVFRSYGSYGYRSYGYGSWPYGYRSHLGGWPYYGHRSFYPYRSWGSWYPYW